MRKILFLTYDGILEPLGYSQILSYLKELSKNYSITIVSVEKENDFNKPDDINIIKPIHHLGNL